MIGRRENFSLISPSFEALLVIVKRRKLGFEVFKKIKVWNSLICWLGNSPKSLLVYVWVRKP